MSPQIFIVLFILHKDYVFFNLFSIKSYDFLKKVYFSKTACQFFFKNLLCILYIKKELSQYTVLFTIIYEKLQFSLVLLIPVFLLYVNLYPTVDFLFEFSPNIQLVYLALKTFVLLGETSPHK